MQIVKSIKKLFDTLKKQDDLVLNKEGLMLFLEDEKSYLSYTKTLISTSFKTGSRYNNTQNVYNKFINELRVNKELVKVIGTPLQKKLLTVEQKLKGRIGNDNPLDAFVMVSGILLNVIDAIEDSVDDIISTDSIIVSDIRISQSLFLGLLCAITLFNSVLSNYILIISYAISQDVTVRKYNLDRLKDNLDSFIYLCNSIANAKGKYAIMNEIGALKTKGLDVRIVSSDNIGAANVSKFLSSTLGIENIFLTIFSTITNFITFIGEAYIDKRHEYYMNIQDKKKWMESQVALIKMNMEDVSHDNEEYNKLFKISEYYSDKIAKYDRKLSRYYSD
jgi:hypothetical protein